MANFADPWDLLRQWSFSPSYDKTQKNKKTDVQKMIPYDDLINMSIEIGNQNFRKSVFGKSKNRNVKIDLGLYVDLETMQEKNESVKTVFRTV